MTKSEDVMKKLNRRDFVRTTAVAGIAAAAPRRLFGQGPTVMTPKAVRPVVVASANGNQYTNGGPATCVEKAVAMITGGSDVVQAPLPGDRIVRAESEGHSGVLD